MCICICNQKEFKSGINKHCKLPGKFYFTYYIFIFILLLLWFGFSFFLWYCIKPYRKKGGISACYVVLGTSDGKQGAARKVPVGRGRGRKGT